jgi:WD repeat-containing protein 68
MTSFDWNPQFSHKAATCSVDTTVAVWDVERGKLETQLIAHDKAVFDLTYNSGNQFSSVSLDGSLRQFDARDLDHSTILYEDSVPLLRVASPTKSSFLIVVLVHENPDLLLFDTRKPGFLSSVLRCGACPNAIAWSGNGHLLAAGLADGTCAIFCDPGEGTKMKPTKVVESLSSGISNAGGVTNLSWAGNDLSLVNGNSVVHKQL